MKITVGEIVKLIGGSLLRGDADVVITNFAALDQADGSCVSFYGNPKYRDSLARSRAGLVLLSDLDCEAPEVGALVQVENPILAFDQIIREFATPAPAFTPGISPSAWVAADAKVNPLEVEVGPNASILSGARIGRRSRIGAGAVIGEGAEIGEDCVIAPNATVSWGCVLGDRVILHSGAIIGADGFGFEFVDGRHQKIEQLGIVRIGDDVEIGASSTVDRARFGETVIGRGTKIDNQVQIGHNCFIGEHCILVAQVGISGSTRIGNYVVLAAQTGVAGHLTIADRTTCGGRSGVISSITESGGTYFGYPARPMREDRRDAMRVKQLGSLIKRVRQLEEQSERYKAALEAGETQVSDSANTP